MLPRHDCYVEAFGGAAWLLFAKAPSRVEVLNDLDSELINFFQVVREQPQELLAQFRFELVSRQRFESLRDISKVELKKLSSVRRAHRFFYLIMAAWGAELGSARFQTSISDNGHGNRLAGALKTLEERLAPVHARLQTVLVECSDWRTCLERYDDSRTVMYLDPPYLGNRCHYVHNMRDVEDHEELIEVLHGLRSKFILSGYDSPEFRKFCRGFRIFSIDYWSGMPTPAANDGSRRRNADILVTNFGPKTDRSHARKTLNGKRTKKSK